MVAHAKPEVVDVDAVSRRLTWAFDIVLPDACFEVTAEPAGGILVKVTTESHEAELHRLPSVGGVFRVWSWEVWATYPEHRQLARCGYPITDFDGAASAMLGVLSGAVALERMTVSPPVGTPASDSDDAEDDEEGDA